MEENNHKGKENLNGELDPFSRFLFGNRNQRVTYKEDDKNLEEQKEHDNNSEEQKKHDNNSEEQKEHVSFSHNRSNPFDDWFLGPRRTGLNGAPRNQNQIENLLNNVDFDLLMETVHMFVETTNQYKPLLKNIPPLFNQFINKLKAK